MPDPRARQSAMRQLLTGLSVVGLLLLMLALLMAGASAVGWYYLAYR